MASSWTIIYEATRNVHLNFILTFFIVIFIVFTSMASCSVKTNWTSTCEPYLLKLLSLNDNNLLKNTENEQAFNWAANFRLENN